MDAFAYREDTDGWRPRHPIVCILDAIGFTIIIAFLYIYRPPLLVATLPLIMMLQYVVSIAYHWWPESGWRNKLDRSVIFMLIGATYVPFWGGLVEPDEAAVRLICVAIAVLIGVAFLIGGASKLVIGLMYVAFTGTGLVVSFYELQAWLQPGPLFAFWTGALLYAAQHIAYSIRWPNPLPELFGYRDVQHVLLVAATTTHAFIALEYL